MSLQLPLGLQLRPSLTLGNFYPGGNLTALRVVEQITSDNSEPYVYLWGGRGVGKSHLLQAACQRVHELDQPAGYISCRQLGEFQPSLLEGFEQMALVCIDDIEELGGRAEWELALFRLFNLLRDLGGRLLVSADRPQPELPVALADLKSRLCWGPGFRLMPLGDADLSGAFIHLARGRGLELQEEAAQFILRRSPRDLHSLQRLLDALDRASLAAQRRLTVPFLREILPLLLRKEEARAAEPPNATIPF